MALLPGSDTTSRRSTRSAARLPAGTFVTPAALHRDGFAGQGALVKGAEGSSRRASAARRAPGAISMMSPGRSWSAATSSRTSPSAVVRMRSALSGTSAIRAVTRRGRGRRHRLPDVPQHEQQQHHGRFGGFAEEQGPTAATVIRVSMAKGEPLWSVPTPCGRWATAPEGGQGKERLTELVRQQGRHPHQAGERQGLPVFAEQVADLCISGLRPGSLRAVF